MLILICLLISKWVQVIMQVIFKPFGDPGLTYASMLILNSVCLSSCVCLAL